MTEMIEDMIKMAIDILERQHGECTIAELETCGFDPITVQAYGQRAINEARRRRLDRRVAREVKRFEAAS